MQLLEINLTFCTVIFGIIKCLISLKVDTSADFLKLIDIIVGPTLWNIPLYLNLLRNQITIRSKID